MTKNIFSGTIPALMSPCTASGEPVRSATVIETAPIASAPIAASAKSTGMPSTPASKSAPSSVPPTK